MSNQRFKDKVVIVTGGAAGIGQSIAMEFAKEGATVFHSSPPSYPLNAHCPPCGNSGIHG